MWFEPVVWTAVAAHFVFLAFGVLGGFLAWRWPWLIRLQIAAVAWLVLVMAAHLTCPLTWIEDRAREQAGMVPKPGGFIANYIAGVFFPSGHQPAATVVTGAVILISWIGFAILSRRRRRIPAPVRPVPR